MDPISYALSAKQKQRIEKFIENPDSDSGIVTQPMVIATGESVTVPSGRMAVLPNLQVDGELVIDGEVFVPSGATVGDLEDEISAVDAKVDTKVSTVTSTDNAIVRFDGTTGQVQDSSVIIDDSGNVSINSTSTSSKSLIINSNTIGGASIVLERGSGLPNNLALDFVGGTSRLTATGASGINGSYVFDIKPSDSETRTTAMALESNGNLLVGTTTDNGVDKLQVNGSISASNLFTPITPYIVSNANFSTKQFISNTLETGTYICKVTGFEVVNVSYNYVFSFIFSVHIGSSSGSNDYEILNVNSSSYTKLNNNFHFYFGDQKRLSVTWVRSELASCTTYLQKLI